MQSVHRVLVDDMKKGDSNMEMEVVFPGGERVDAYYKGHVIKTDQLKHGEDTGSAPQPFDLFLASIGTCAGIYVLSFCANRNIPTDGIKLVQRITRNEETRMVAKISIEIQVPSDFPEKYKKAVIRSADLCAVKKHLLSPPEFEIFTRTVEDTDESVKCKV